MRRLFRVTPEMRSKDKNIAARAYVNAGIKLVIVHGIDNRNRCTCRKPDCSHPGKHPIVEFFRHAVKDATLDLKVIRRALRACPDANLAGALEGLTVIDVDGPKGEKTISSLTLPKTARTQTLRGQHQFFAGELEGGSIKGEEFDLLTGKGRYVILPPSRTKQGTAYRWRYPWLGAAPLPECINELARDRQRPVGRAAGMRAKPIPEGERNNTLFRIACGLRYRGLNEKTVWQMVQIANERECKEPVSEGELKAILESSGRYRNDDAPLFGPPAIRQPLPIEFLWYPYIPRHGVTLLAGDPGTGKSLLGGLLCATVTNGKRLPLSKDRAANNHVLILSAEDSWARTTLPRFLAAGGNIDNVYTMAKFRVLGPEVLQEFRTTVESWRPSFVVIDTISAYMGSGRDMHRQNEVGEFLGDLTEIAEQHDASILALAHLNKQGTEHPLYRIVGSIGFSATVRSVVFFGEDPENDSQLLMAHGKINAAEKGRSITFKKVGGGRNGIPLLRPVGFSAATDWDACRHVHNPVGRPNVEQERAATYILSALGRSPKSWHEIQLRAEAECISTGTLRLVRAQLRKDGSIVQIGKGPGAKWRIGKRDTSESN